MANLSAGNIEQLNALIRECGHQARRMAAESFQVFEKGLEDYVTTVDRLLDEQLARGVTALFPTDGVITEENPNSQQAFANAQGRLWMIDPIDGTEDFIKGGSHYSVMVGLWERGVPQLGWIYAPVFDQLYFGGKQMGLFRLDGTLPQPTVTPLVPQEPASPSRGYCPVIIGDRDVRQYGEAIAQLIPEAQFSSLGSFGLKVMEVIQGRAGIYVYFNRRVKLWDTVGPVALAQAAGLVCCDLEGKPLEFTPEVVDTETLIHRQTIMIGWPVYVETLRSRLQQAVMQKQSR